MAMKCPECGANAECKETRRGRSENKTRRTYECFGCPKTKQIHKFNTLFHMIYYSLILLLHSKWLSKKNLRYLMLT